VLGLASGSGRRYDGPFGKSDRAAFFSVLAVLFALFALPAWLAPALLWLAFVLGCLTVANRVRRALAGGASDG
jgi:CDP-diacylglycerol--glycerol-3-phosphate 3-phosphatidyltransferase